jgi:hypothetical protein
MPCFPKQLRQPLACVEHPRLDCAALGSGDVCDLVYRFLVVVNEVDNFSMRGRQLYKAIEKNCAVLVLLGFCLGLSEGSSTESYVSSSSGSVDRLFMASLPCDERWPGAMSILASAPRTCAPCAKRQKNVTDEIFRDCFIIDEAKRESIDEHLVACVKGMHPELVAGCNTFDQAIVRLVRSN